MTDTNTLAQTRLDPLELMEDLGSSACLLREAHGDLQRGGESSAKIAASDVIDIMVSVERQASDIAAKLAKWTAAQ